MSPGVPKLTISTTNTLVDGFDADKNPGWGGVVDRDTFGGEKGNVEVDGGFGRVIRIRFGRVRSGIRRG